MDRDFLDWGENRAWHTSVACFAEARGLSRGLAPLSGHCFQLESIFMLNPAD